MSDIDPTRFVEWGYRASQDFLEHNKPLDESISKIASDYGLTPKQISRVVESANLRTDNALAKTSGEKSVQFKVASVQDVMSILDTEPAEKIASDYFTTPNFQSSHNYMEAFGVDSISNEHEVNEKLSMIKNFQEKCAMAQDELVSRIENNKMETMEVRDEFYKIAKQLVLRGEDLAELAHDAQHALDNTNYRVQLAEEFKTASLKMIEDGVYGPVLQAKLAEAVDKDLISSKMNFTTEAGADPETGKVKIVNGAHPVFTTINTLVNHMALDDSMKRSTEVLKSKSEYVSSKGKDLNTSKQTDSFVKKKENE
jgi:hypothetical protein